MHRQVVFDTETTGLYAQQGDRILEIGCVELVGRKLSGRHLHLYINPERDSHEEALRVHGLTSEFLADKPRFVEVVDEVLAFMAGAELIIHNAPFDLGFFDEELKRLQRAPLHTHVEGVIDTLALAKERYPGKRNSLDALCDRLGVDNSGRQLHGALLDAQLLADVYVCMTRGQDALLIADEAGVQTPGGLLRAGGDLSAFTLPVIAPSAQELAAHHDVLAQIDKSSGGKTLWRSMDENGFQVETVQ